MHSKSQQALSDLDSLPRMNSVRPQLAFTTGPTCILYMCGGKPIWPHIRAAKAAAEFQKILDHRGIVLNEPSARWPISNWTRLRAPGRHCQEPRGTYQDFSQETDAIPNIPILLEAKAEYAKLQ